MFVNDPAFRQRHDSASWFAVASAAALACAFALTACGPRDERTGATATSASPQSSSTMAATTAPAAVTAADTDRGAPVPPAVSPVPTTAATPPGSTLAQAAPVQPGIDANAPPAAANDGAAPPVRPVPAAAPRATRVAQAPAPSGRLGSVDSIEPIRERPQGTGAGAVIGGVAGAVLGNQFGHGLGRAAMTGLGVAGGAIAGNNVERNVRKRVVGYRVHVRLDDGTTRTFERSAVGDLRVGDRVRVERNGFRRT